MKPPDRTRGEEKRRSLRFPPPPNYGLRCVCGLLTSYLVSSWRLHYCARLGAYWRGMLCSSLPALLPPFFKQRCLGLQSAVRASASCSSGAAGHPLPWTTGVRRGYPCVCLCSHTTQDSTRVKHSSPAGRCNREKQRYKGKAHCLRINVSVALRFCIFSLPVKESSLLSFKNQEKATKMNYKYRGISESDV